MSIIMLGAKLTTDSPPAPGLHDASLRNLLDHIAVGLAEEYVRLMEAAAAAEVPSEVMGTPS